MGLFYFRQLPEIYRQKMALIYHLIRQDEWHGFLEADVYEPQSLQTEGFIHFSTREQVLATAGRFFAEESELVAIEIPEKRLKPHLRYEPTPDGEDFPHLYAALELDLIEEVRLLVKDQSGNWTWG